ncbi:MAG: homocitrate synthase/isopropylmalate synthase family protein [Chloroflexota bacterium]
MAEILDSTLREGEQTPLVNFTVEEKVEIARLLDAVGVEMIEAGDPSVSPKVFEAVRRIAGLGLKAEVVAHSLATRSGIEKAHAAGAARVAIFYPTSRIHLQNKLGKDEDAALQTITEHIRFARSLGLKVRYTPEDASRTDFEFLVRVCNAAIEAGADRISFADTLGVLRPHETYERVKALRQRLLPCKMDLHCHNDFGLALANALEGLRAGADCIHTTVNGMGERAGIPDLAEAALALNRWLGVEHYDLRALPALSAYVERVSGFFVAPNKPVTGLNAFSHKSGVHTNGVLKDPRTYESVDPALLGRERRIVIDKYTGKKAVAARLEEYGLQVQPDELERIVEEIKTIGDERKILHDADILEIAEQVTGRRLDIFPREINAIVMIAVESHVYTGAVVRRLKNLKYVFNVYEITGEQDIAAYIKVPTTLELNNFIEELRTMPGVKQTETRVVLKKHADNGF